MLQVRSLNAFYDRTQVLHGINLRVDEREIVGLIGANGAGKSSTLLTYAFSQSAGRCRGRDLCLPRPLSS